MAFRVIRTGTPGVDQVMLDIEAAIRTLEQANGKRSIVKGISLTTADKVVSHGLGHPITGYNVIRRSSAGVVFDVTASTAPAAWVYLRASAPVVVTLEFF